MQTKTLSIFAVLATVITACVASDQQENAPAGVDGRPPQQTEYGRIDIDGGMIAYRNGGAKKPVVLFEAGFGSGLETWDSVFADISEHARAIAYSRPGYGDSALSLIAEDGARTSQEVAYLLKDLLSELGVREPVILVGHSLGGLYVLKFAQDFPEMVHGIVLVDSRPKELRSACQQFGIGSCAKDPGAIIEDWPVHMRAEIAGMERSELAAPAAKELGAIPVTVITAVEAPSVDQPEKWREIWVNEQKSFAGALENGRYVEAVGSGHYIHHERPDLVIREILRMTAMSQTPAPHDLADE